MFRRSRARSALLCGLLTLLVAASCATRTTSTTCTGTSPILRQRGTLTVAADLSYSPFAYDRPDDIPAGFEADLIRAIAKQLKMELTIVNRATSALVPGLLGHRHDLAMSGLIDDDALREETCISAPYLDAELAVLVPAPNAEEVEAPEDLDGQRVGVLRNSRAEDWTHEHLGGADIRTMPADADLIAGLKARTLDGVIEELAVGRYAATKSRQIEIAAVIETGRKYVMAAAPDNGALIARVDRALERLEANGKLEKIRTKWFER